MASLFYDLLWAGGMEKEGFKTTEKTVHATALLLVNLMLSISLRK